METETERKNGPALPRWKRVLDIACIAMALPAILPIMLVIVLAIRLCSRGPLLFKQERIGYYGRPFVCFKFRTMKVEAETRSHEAYLAKLMTSPTPMTKLDLEGDPRIIPIGLFLRSTGLDELPQLINVLRGEMSLVGPRPCIRYEYERFKPEHRERFHALPGISGLWQVSGKNTTTFQEMVDLDIAYVRNMSLRGDLQILFRTIPVLFDQTNQICQRKCNRPQTSPKTAGLL